LKISISDEKNCAIRDKTCAIHEKTCVSFLKFSISDEKNCASRHKTCAIQEKTCASFYQKVLKFYSIMVDFFLKRQVYLIKIEFIL
jgi:hypothetical protein